MNTYKLTLIAVLASLAVVGRLFFQFVPNVQPVTSIIIICGFYLGPVSGIMLAFLSTYLSNLILGMGIWVVWQLVGWTLIGCISGWIGRFSFTYPLHLLILFGICSGYMYGFIVSLANYSIAGKFWPYYLAGLPYDTYHAIGNGVFIAILFPVITKIFHRYRQNTN
ncbi:ECF transporter S component [Aquibacillus sediminis]|uniref:ECF transporter S component n=1 Tax=Aquibacillus sediminis TaxID=2574734 RepID=UPI0011095305|nr:ECF transporter S component [Aquibacillus sediminis]